MSDARSAVNTERIEEMPETVVVDGVEYVRRAPSTGNVIVIAPNGWIFVGSVVGTDPHVTLTCASVVRKWTNGRGIGALADPAHRDDYTLDAIPGSITVHNPVATLECQW